jgi:hydrogenase expression/formation protein HypC
MGKVDFGGVKRKVSLAYLPDADVGDYVIVHAGFAISKLDEEEAHETLKLMAEAGILQELSEGEAEHPPTPVDKSPPT